jgi:hypothetical protein
MTLMRNIDVLEVINCGSLGVYQPTLRRSWENGVYCGYHCENLKPRSLTLVSSLHTKMSSTYILFDVSLPYLRIFLRAVFGDLFVIRKLQATKELGVFRRVRKIAKSEY